MNGQLTDNGGGWGWGQGRRRRRRLGLGIVLGGSDSYKDKEYTYPLHSETQ